MHRPNLNHSNIPEKANRVLYLILIGIFLILIRVWTLTVIQYDDKLEESKKPQRKTLIEPAKRGTIRDRFNIPLAINKIQYNVAILYAPIQTIPSVKWKIVEGKKVKTFARRQYISDFSEMLSKELNMDKERIEDLIHSKASLYYSIPFILKEEISEKEYYRLKNLERQWVGLQVQRVPQRKYPLGRVGADLIGYTGAINQSEYEKIIGEIKLLENVIQEDERGDIVTFPDHLNNLSEVRLRLKDLKEMAYRITDHVGKTGIEAQFEEELRGFRGKKSYYSDAKGNFFRELPGSKPPLSGERILLSISSELQEFAENLLVQNERIRVAKISQKDPHQPISNKQPWIKGGTIIAMDPNNGEILAMASYPRFDPNDFIASGNPEIRKNKKNNISRWLESEDYIAKIWDQKLPLIREVYDDREEKIIEEEIYLSWNKYLHFILEDDSLILKEIEKVKNIRTAALIQSYVSELLEISGQNNLYWLFKILYKDALHLPYGKAIPKDVQQAIEENLEQHQREVTSLKEKLDPYLLSLQQNYDKVLFIDLLRLTCDENSISEDFFPYCDKELLSSHIEAGAAFSAVNEALQDLIKTLYHEQSFKEWRKNNESSFLKEIRIIEKKTLRYPKPYIDYLDQKENELFLDFWEKNRWIFHQAFFDEVETIKDESLKIYIDTLQIWQKELKENAHEHLSWFKAYHIVKKALTKFHSSFTVDYLKTFRSYSDLNRPLYGRYKNIHHLKGIQLEKHLARAFYPKHGFSFGRSHAYRQATTQGSLFKLVTAYTALKKRYEEVDDDKINFNTLNPLEMTDIVEYRGKECSVGYLKNGTLIPRYYKGGRLPRSSMKNIGTLDIIKALETSSNPYFSLLASEIIHSPNDLLEDAKKFSYGKKTGINLPYEIRGSLPQDLLTNKTGLYSFAIGQHSLVVTPLQTSVMLSTIANGGKVLKPEIVSHKIKTERDQNHLFANEEFPYQEYLSLVNIDFPFFSAASKEKQKNLITRSQPTLLENLPMPEIIRDILLEGMKRVSDRIYHTGLKSLSQFYRDYPEAISDYIDIHKYVFGKTSTAESMEQIDLSLLTGTNMYTHVWYGGISFNPEDDKVSYLSKDALGKPELVVVVYLRFGKFGKEAAPIAAQIVKKWREIKKKQ